MSILRGRRVAAVSMLSLALVAACSSSSSDPKAAEPAKATTSTIDDGGAGAPVGEPPLVQDLWLYQRIATIDASGAEVDLTDQVVGLLAGEPTTSTDLGGDVTFHHHESLAARLVGPDGEVRADVDVQAGLVDASGDRMVGVVATPDTDSDEPIDDRHRVQLDLTALEDVLAPGDPLIMEVGFVQAFGDGSSEEGLGGPELLGHRLAAGRANVVGTTDDGASRMVLSTEIGSAIEGSVWSDMPAKSHRMMDGFTKGFQGCKLGLKCVKNYFDEMIDVVADFGTAFDCNTGAGRCSPTTTPDTTPGTTPETTPNSTPRRTPDPTPSRNNRGAKVHGDPHLQTFDGHDYAMQAVGEFVAARSDDLEVQIRTEALAGSTDVSVLSGVAVLVDGHTLSVSKDLAHLDGDLIDPDSLVESVEIGSATLSARGNGYEITTVDGQQVAMTNVSGLGFELWVGLEDGDDTDFVGLFGDNDGDGDNDYVTRDGEVLAEPDFDELYGTFVESWRLSDDESHFHYGDGESTQTFTDKTMPRRAVTLESLAPAERARAAAVCRAAGVVDQTTLDQCTLDYAISGDIGFVRASITVDTVIAMWDGLLLADGSDVNSPGPDDGHGPDDPDVSDPDDLEDVRTVEAAWSVTASQIREGDESFTRVICPPGGRPSRVWGTDTYSDDSSVCTAAVHRELVTFEDGGEVLIEHRPGLGFYRASTRNGVSTIEWDSWPGSFVFIGARGVAIEGD